ncbi:hypothetical protein A8C56_16815 [Niabella ginsenosidivorans]|uniref:Sel1 repeat family protein n=1 Tax=Niabella ginsenosidivorans TaxID=1176587 RepID=A0A1A9I417_9BACT|nr:tetratricopeptide repeat protein [Niabella ginsenosidivorans]ANH82408.1 hypothetical protein A8C56_16815 [Niabella ginsenosidivorans]
MNNIVIYEKYFNNSVQPDPGLLSQLNEKNIRVQENWFRGLALLEQLISEYREGAPKEQLTSLFDLLFYDGADHTASVYLDDEAYQWFFKKMTEILGRLAALCPEAGLELAIAYVLARREYRDLQKSEQWFRQAITAGVEAAAPVYCYYQYAGLLPGADKEKALVAIKELAEKDNPWGIIYYNYYLIWFSPEATLTEPFYALKEHPDKKIRKNYYHALQGYYGRKEEKEKQLEILKEGIEKYNSSYCRLVLTDVQWPDAGSDEEKEALLGAIKKAYDLGAIDGAVSLGLRYLPQQPQSAQDFDKAVCWLKQAWKYGNSYTAYRLAYLYLYNEWIKDIPAGLALMKAAKEAGSIDAAIEWAEMHLEGTVTPVNKETAYATFTELHQKEIPYATYRLGNFYEYGEPDMGIAADLTKALEHYKQAADKNLPVAQYNTGRFLKYGFDDTPADMPAALSYFTKAAAGNNAQAYVELGLYEESGGRQDYAKAFEYFSRAAAIGYPYANYLKGLYLEFDYHRSGQKDPAGAFACYEYAAGYNEINAVYELGRCYKFGVGTEQNYDKGFEYLKKAADAGYPKALAELALSYERAEGVAEDREKAVGYMEKAAQQNYVYAQYAVGRYYLHGYAQPDAEKGREWLEKAAEQEHPYALLELGDYYLFDYNRLEQYDKAIDYYKRAKEQQVFSDGLGLCYEYGIGTEASPATAFNEYTLAAEYGNTNAKYRLGKCYYDGYGTDKNLEASFRWFSESANEGNDNAKVALGRQYLKGEGVQQQPGKAVELFKNAANNELANAQFELANCYLMGEGVDEDEDQALYWFEKAAENGHEGAKKITGKRR